MPNEFLQALLTATTTPVTSEGSLDHHPDSILGERRDPKTQMPLTSDAEIMTAEDGIGRGIFAAGRAALQASYETKSAIAKAVKSCTELLPPHRTPQGRLVPGAVINGTTTEYTRVKPELVLPLRDAATAKFTSAAKKIDAHSVAIQDGIASLNRTINKSIETAPTAPDDVQLHNEIRGYVSKLDQRQRVAFVKQAIDDSDLTVARAILGKGQAFLSGLSRAEHTTLRQMAEQRFNPREYAQREIGHKVLRTVDSAGSQLVLKMSDLLNGPARVPVNKTSDALDALRGGK